MTSQQDKYIKKFSKHSLITKGIVKKTNIGVIGKNFQLTNETSAKQSSSSSRKVISPDTIAGLSKDWERTPLPPPNEPTFEDEDVNNGDSPANELGEQPDEYTVAEEAKKPFRSDIISLSDFYPAYANQNSIEPNEVSALLDIQHNLRQLSHEVIENFIQKAQDDPELGETVRQTKEFFKLNIENTKRYLSVLNSLFEEHDRLNNALNIKSSKFIKETLLENYYSKNEFNQAYNTKILIQIFNEFNLFLTRGPRISSAKTRTIIKKHSYELKIESGQKKYAKINDALIPCDIKNKRQPFIGFARHVYGVNFDDTTSAPESLGSEPQNATDFGLNDSFEDKPYIKRAKQFMDLRLLWSPDVINNDRSMSAVVAIAKFLNDELALSIALKESRNYFQEEFNVFDTAPGSVEQNEMVYDKIMPANFDISLNDFTQLTVKNNRNVVPQQSQLVDKFAFKTDNKKILPFETVSISTNQTDLKNKNYHFTPGSNYALEGILDGFGLNNGHLLAINNKFQNLEKEFYGIKKLAENKNEFGTIHKDILHEHLSLLKRLKGIDYNAYKKGEFNPKKDPNAQLVKELSLFRTLNEFDTHPYFNEFSTEETETLAEYMYHMIKPGFDSQGNYLSDESADNSLAKERFNQYVIALKFGLNASGIPSKAHDTTGKIVYGKSYHYDHNPSEPIPSAGYMCIDPDETFDDSFVELKKSMIRVYKKIRQKMFSSKGQYGSTIYSATDANNRTVAHNISEHILWDFVYFMYKNISTYWNSFQGKISIVTKEKILAVASADEYTIYEKVSEPNHDPNSNLYPSALEKSLSVGMFANKSFVGADFYSETGKFHYVLNAGDNRHYFDATLRTQVFGNPEGLDIDIPAKYNVIKQLLDSGKTAGSHIGEVGNTAKLVKLFNYFKIEDDEFKSYISSLDKYFTKIRNSVDAMQKKIDMLSGKSPIDGSAAIKKSPWMKGITFVKDNFDKLKELGVTENINFEVDTIKIQASALIQQLSSIIDSQYAILYNKQQLKLANKALDILESKINDKTNIFVDESKMPEHVKNTLHAMLKQSLFLNNRTKILTVGIPPGFSNNLKQQVKHISDSSTTTSKKQQDVIQLEVYKQNVKYNKLVFKPLTYTFELSRFCLERVSGESSIRIKKNTDDFNKLLDFFPTFNYDYASDIIGNKSFKDINPADELASDEYIFLSQAKKDDIRKNHITSYLLTWYMKYLIGIDFDESRFTVNKSYNPNNSLQDNELIQRLSEQLELTEEESAYMRAYSSKTILKTGKTEQISILSPKKYERIFNIPINPNMFVLDEYKTQKTMSGKQQFESLIKSTKLSAKNDKFNVIKKIQKIKDLGLSSKGMSRGSGLYGFTDYEHSGGAYRFSYHENDVAMVKYWVVIKTL